MIRKEPTKNLDVIGYLNISPENAIGEYITSKQQDEFFVKPPNWDSAGDCSELLFIYNVREHNAMLSLQKDLLESSKADHAVNLHRINRLYKMISRLRQRFIEANGFLRDCKEKRINAEKKVADEVALHKKLGKDIAKNRHAVQELDKFRTILKQTTAQYEPYEQVLNEVVKQSNIYVSEKDLMDRCDALMLAQTDISRLKLQKLQEIEEMNQKMVSITNEAALRILGMKNILTELERSYNKAYAECHKWENILNETKNCLCYNDLTNHAISDTIFNLYRLLCTRQGVESTLQRNDLEKQMDFIKNEVEILSEVLNRYEQYELEAEKTGKKLHAQKIPC